MSLYRWLSTTPGVSLYRLAYNIESGRVPVPTGFNAPPSCPCTDGLLRRQACPCTAWFITSNPVVSLYRLDSNSPSCPCTDGIRRRQACPCTAWFITSNPVVSLYRLDSHVPPSCPCTDGLLRRQACPCTAWFITSIPVVSLYRLDSTHHHRVPVPMVYYDARRVPVPPGL